MNFRELTDEDSKSLWDLMLKIDDETEFMMFEPNERSQFTNINNLKLKIKDGKNNGDFIFGGIFQDELIGYIIAEKGRFNRIKHKAYVVIGILKDFQGKGIGTEFFRNLELWALKENIKRLELTVEMDNIAAINLYKKFGFKIEGVRKYSMLVNGSYKDEYYMGRIL